MRLRRTIRPSSTQSTWKPPCFERAHQPVGQFAFVFGEQDAHREPVSSGVEYLTYSAQTTSPLQAVASTTMPNAMRYQANGTKLWVEM